MLHPARVIPPGAEALAREGRSGGLGDGAAQAVVVVSEYGGDLDLAANGLDVARDGLDPAGQAEV